MAQLKDFPKFHKVSMHLIYQMAVINAIDVLLPNYKIANERRVEEEGKVFRHLLDDVYNVLVNCPNDDNGEFSKLTSIIQDMQRESNMKSLENKLLYILKDDKKYLSKL